MPCRENILCCLGLCINLKGGPHKFYHIAVYLCTSLYICNIKLNSSNCKMIDNVYLRASTCFENNARMSTRTRGGGLFDWKAVIKLNSLIEHLSFLH